jgi:hypothetical protein
VGRVFLSLFSDKIALGAKVKAAVEVNTSRRGQGRGRGSEY